jgi:hypothetical protein
VDHDDGLDEEERGFFFLLGYIDLFFLGLGPALTGPMAYFATLATFIASGLL